MKEFLDRLHECTAQSQIYCDVCYAAEMIVKEIPKKGTQNLVKQAADAFTLEVSKKKMDIGKDLTLRLQMLKEGAAVKELSKAGKKQNEEASKKQNEEASKKQNEEASKEESGKQGGDAAKGKGKGKEESAPKELAVSAQEPQQKKARTS